MGLFDSMRKPTTYQVKVKCKNCGLKGYKEIPKGLTPEEFFESRAGVCGNCGLNTIVKVENV